MRRERLLQKFCLSLLVAVLSASAVAKLISPPVEARAALTTALGGLAPPWASMVAHSTMAWLEGLVALGLVWKYSRPVALWATGGLLLTWAWVGAKIRVEECGCFGDLFVLSAAQHFLLIKIVALAWLCFVVCKETRETASG